VQALLDLLADEVPEVRAAAAHALGKLGHWPAVSHLAPLLRDRVWIVRRAAGLALLALGAPGLLYLRRYLSDTDPFAADMAQQALDLPSTVGLETSPWP
jgi:HEAT repeat protein